MFCKNCGSEIKEGIKFCPNCGADCSFVGQATEKANEALKHVENQFDSAVNDVKQTFNNNNNGNVPPYGGERLQDDRGLVSYILLSFITCGIYSYYFIYKLAHDINIACDGDGENTSGLVVFILLSFVTCGIYALFWYYNLGNRLAENAPRYGLSFQENGTTLLLWYLFGSMLCGIGPFVAMHILITNTNKICNAYNRAHNL